MVFKIPFALLPQNATRGLAAKLKNAGGFLSAFFPGLNEELLQAQIDSSNREYASIAVAVGLANSVIATLFVLIMGLIMRADLFGISILLGLLVGNASFFTIIAYPRILTSKRVRLQENQLIPATRQLLIELKSGVPLFNAMTSISTGYGEVSLEFRKMVNKISGGVPELDALADATRENPSFQFRKVLWQISNALKVGSDVGDSLSSLLTELEKEKIDQIH
ncbi:MAG: type II secretion system F family protein, partial [Candidatus Micrarchaeota archaeon]